MDRAITIPQLQTQNRAQLFMLQVANSRANCRFTLHDNDTRHNR